MDETTWNATKRLVELAKSDTGQSRIARNFVLAWWNFDEFGGFDPVSMSSLDEKFRADIATIITYLASLESPKYPTEFRADIAEIIKTWKS